MKLEGIHHITAITADAQANVDFYVGVLGLRLVKKSVNQDYTSVYHLFYADETGDPGSDITFFEYPNLPKGRAGAGMIHRIVWRVGSTEALDFWQQRLTDAGYDARRTDDALIFEDPEGLAHELIVSSEDQPLTANHPEILAELALQGFHAARAYAHDPQSSKALLTETLEFETTDGTSFTARGEHRQGHYIYDAPPPERGLQGAGTVHHIAFASPINDHEAWRERIAGSGRAHPTPVIDRHYFRSIYFREPSGVLFEIATIGPGFTVDEPLEHLGEKLSLTPQFEHLREQIEPTLTPIHDPREDWVPAHPHK
jgi:glyoxalase family protein